MRPPSDLLEQIGSLIAHDSWEPVLASAAESARDPRGQIVSQELVEGEMPLEVTHDMVMGVRLVDLPAGAECAAKVLLSPSWSRSTPRGKGRSGSR